MEWIREVLWRASEDCVEKEMEILGSRYGFTEGLEVKGIWKVVGEISIGQQLLSSQETP